MIDAPPASPAAAAEAPEGRRPARLPVGLALALWGGGLLVPPLGAGAIAALALAASLPPLVWLTGLGRWEVYSVFQAMALGMALWLLAAPPAALALAALGRRWLAAPLAGLAATGLCTLGVAWAATGGPGAEGFAAELVEWSPVFAPFGLGAALWLALLRAGAGWLARRRREAVA